jgi:uncharacterized membrane protein (Fun14 family)
VYSWLGAVFVLDFAKITLCDLGCGILGFALDFFARVLTGCAGLATAKVATLAKNGIIARDKLTKKHNKRRALNTRGARNINNYAGDCDWRLL